MLSDQAECGLDIQVWHERMDALQHKFLSRAEQEFFERDTKLITLAWAAKEAAYKWLGHRGIDFIEHLQIIDFTRKEDALWLTIDTRPRGKARRLRISGFIDKEYAFASVIM